MIKSLKEALQNLVSTSIEIGKTNASYIIGDYKIIVYEIGPLRRCKTCLRGSQGNCPYENKLDCPDCGDTELNSMYGDEIPDPCNTDCWNYAHGTCPYIGGDKYQCPRYRLYEL